MDRHYLTVFLDMALSFPSPVRADVTEENVEEIELDRDGKVSVKNFAGDINISTWDKEMVKMTTVKTAGNEADLENVIIKIRRSHDSLVIKTKYPEKNKTGVTVSFELKAPDRASVKVETKSGGVSVQNIGGKLEIETISGKADVRDCLKGFKCETISGDIKAMNIVGDASLSAVSSDIYIQNLKGDLSASTVNGDIIMLDIENADRITGETVNGDIFYSGQVYPTGFYELKNHSGDTAMKLPAGAEFEISGNIFSGDVSISEEFNNELEFQKVNRKFSGILGEGGADIEITTFNGDIDISVIGSISAHS